MAWNPFGTRQQQQPQTQTQQQPQQQQPAPQQQQQQQPQDFSNFWKAPENQTGLTSPIPAFDMNQVMQIGRQQRFVNPNIPEDVKQRLQNGDFAPLLELVQNVAQMTYSKALHDSAMITQQGFTQFGDQVTNFVPTVVGDQNFRSSLSQEYDKLANDPRYSPIFNAAVTQINSTMMDKPEAERKQAVVNYFRDMATAMGAKFDDGSASQQNQQQFTPSSIGIGESGQVEDWAAFAGDSSFGNYQGQSQFGNSEPSGMQQSGAPATQSSF